MSERRARASMSGWEPPLGHACRGWLDSLELFRQDVFDASGGRDDRGMGLRLRSVGPARDQARTTAASLAFRVAHDLPKTCRTWSSARASTAGTTRKKAAA